MWVTCGWSSGLDRKDRTVHPGCCSSVLAKRGDFLMQLRLWNLPRESHIDLTQLHWFCFKKANLKKHKWSIILTKSWIEWINFSDDHFSVLACIFQLNFNLLIYSTLWCTHNNIYYIILIMMISQAWPYEWRVPLYLHQHHANSCRYRSSQSQLLVKEHKGWFTGAGMN